MTGANPSETNKPAQLQRVRFGTERTTTPAATGAEHVNSGLRGQNPSITQKNNSRSFIPLLKKISAMSNWVIWFSLNVKKGSEVLRGNNGKE